VGLGRASESCKTLRKTIRKGGNFEVLGWPVPKRILREDMSIGVPVAGGRKSPYDLTKG